MKKLLCFLCAMSAVSLANANPPLIWGSFAVENPAAEDTAEDARRAPAPFSMVGFVAPGTERKEVSLVLIPGGGLTAQQYIATHDGRDGWAPLFARAGYPTYMTGWPSPESVFPAAPADTGGNYQVDSTWDLWGIGPEYPNAYEDTQFPVDSQQGFNAMLRVETNDGGGQVLDQLMENLDKVVVLGHSAGGRNAFGLASRYPDKVVGVIVVEPVPCPTDEETLKADFVDLGRPMLSVWGDNRERGRPSMLDRFDSCAAADEIISGLGGSAETIDLPARGISGNTHLLMQDLNSDEIAAMVINWLNTEVN